MLSGLQIPQDASASFWIGSKLEEEIGAVTNLVPSCFDTYVRIFHPAVAPDEDRWISWAEVASATGRVMHAQAQWHKLVGSARPCDVEGSEWKGKQPTVGVLPREILAPLTRVLEQFTATPQNCFFGLWPGWITFQTSFVSQEDNTEGEAGKMVTRSGDNLPGPRFKLSPIAGRDYVLLAGPLSIAPEIANPLSESGLSEMSPNLIWPADRAWFLATEIDFDSTLVGGSRELCAAIVGADEFEALEIEPNALLTVDADKVN